MKRLIDIGFKFAGKWTLSERGLNFHLDRSLECEQNVLYAFSVIGELMYIGKTTQSLCKRMQGYKNPASSSKRGGTTNIKNNRNITTALQAGSSVEIYVLCPQIEEWHGGFLVNLSAGLEDSLIKELSPPWNGRTYVVSVAVGASSTLGPRRPTSPAQTACIQPLQEMTLRRGAAISKTGAPTSQTLIAHARGLQETILETLTRKTSFRVGVIGSDLEFTPASSRTVRRERQTTLASVLKRYAEIASYQMCDYQDLSFNASYILALVKHWENTQCRSADT